MKFWNVIYNWADAGYVISKGTLDKMMQKFDSDEACDKGGQYWKNSDWYLAKHLSQMNIKPVDTRDHIGRSRFIGNINIIQQYLVLCYLILHIIQVIFDIGNRYALLTCLSTYLCQ